MVLLLPFDGFILLFFLLSFIAGCSYKLMANYDEIIDKNATELQAKVETFLIKMKGAAGTPDGEYKNQKIIL
jgi:hypothetical protein